jgi:hypothetical protein
MESKTFSERLRITTLPISYKSSNVEYIKGIKIIKTYWYKGGHKFCIIKREAINQKQM